MESTTWGRQDINTAQGVAECCIYLEAPPSAVFSIHDEKLLYSTHFLPDWCRAADHVARLRPQCV